MHTVDTAACADAKLLKLEIPASVDMLDTFVDVPSVAIALTLDEVPNKSYVCHYCTCSK